MIPEEWGHTDGEENRDKEDKDYMIFSSSEAILIRPEPDEVLHRGAGNEGAVHQGVTQKEKEKLKYM